MSVVYERLRKGNRRLWIGGIAACTISGSIRARPRGCAGSRRSRSVPSQSRDRMSARFKVGDHVRWNSEAEQVSGRIIKVHTRDTECKGYPRHASKDSSLSANFSQTAVLVRVRRARASVEQHVAQTIVGAWPAQ